LSGTEMRLSGIYEAILVLAGKGDLALVQDHDAQTAARAHTDRINLRIFDKARGDGELTILASPVTGGGVLVPRFHQLFLLARIQGRESANELAQFAWDLLAAQNQRMVKDGKPLETAEENLAELAREAREFIDQRLPVLRALKIA
jgi:hypothetical protein